MAGYRGKQGRKPLPTALKLVRGNPGRRPLNENEPQVEPKIPEPPRELPARAKREWRRIGKQLLAAGLVTELDRMALAALVQSYARWIETQQLLSKSGLLVRNKDGLPRVNPLLRISREAQAEFTRMLSEFGMTPSSRSRVSVHQTDAADPFEKFLSRRTS